MFTFISKVNWEFINTILLIILNIIIYFCSKNIWSINSLSAIKTTSKEEKAVTPSFNDRIKSPLITAIWVSFIGSFILTFTFYLYSVNEELFKKYYTYILLWSFAFSITLLLLILYFIGIKHKIFYGLIPYIIFFILMGIWDDGKKIVLLLTVISYGIAYIFVKITKLLVEMIGNSISNKKINPLLIKSGASTISSISLMVLLYIIKLIFD